MFSILILKWNEIEMKNNKDDDILLLCVKESMLCYAMLCYEIFIKICMMSLLFCFRFKAIHNRILWGLPNNMESLHWPYFVTFLHIIFAWSVDASLIIRQNKTYPSSHPPTHDSPLEKEPFSPHSLFVFLMSITAHHQPELSKAEVWELYSDLMSHENNNQQHRVWDQPFL